jgi:uncharacterized membrane protein YjfL (UPF0719 family)
MTLFPIGTLIRLIGLARNGSRLALLALTGFLIGLGVIVAAAIDHSTAGIVCGAVLFAAGCAGSRPRNRRR